MPWLPASAAAALTLRSPLSIESDVQAERLPDSKLSAKILSEGSDPISGTTVFGNSVEIEVLVAAPSDVWVAVTADVGNVAIGVRVIVEVAIGADVDVRVGVGICPDPLPTQLALPESVNVCPAMGTNCQS